MGMLQIEEEVGKAERISSLALAIYIYTSLVYKSRHGEVRLSFAGGVACIGAVGLVIRTWRMADKSCPKDFASNNHRN
jgi:hypothetical protein